MALAALLISIAALVLAAASAWFARSQAVSQAEATGIERGRRHDEREPRFRAEIEDLNGDGGSYRLWLTLTSVEPLDEVMVELAEDAALEFAPFVSGVQDQQHAGSYQGELKPEDRACWRVNVIRERHRDSETILVRSRRGAEDWLSRVVIDDVPYDVGWSIG